MDIYSVNAQIHSILEDYELLQGLPKTCVSSFLRHEILILKIKPEQFYFILSQKRGCNILVTLKILIVSKISL